MRTAMDKIQDSAVRKEQIVDASEVLRARATATICILEPPRNPKPVVELMAGQGKVRFSE